MIRCFGLARLSKPPAPCVASIGTFDGIHLGHRRVLEVAAERSRAAELPTVAVTFDRHPAATLRQGSEPPAIASLQQKLVRIESCGIDICVVLPFDRELADTSAAEFLDRILVGSIGATQIVLGQDFAFGKGREGTAEWLEGRIVREVVPPIEFDGERISSSAIRSAIQSGEVERAGKMLGQPFRMEGVVVTGQKLGRTLGYPTANLHPTESQVRPANGVYAGTVRIGKSVHTAAIAAGTRPAVGGGEHTVEAFLLDYNGESLYGRAVEFAFHSRLREELDFPDLDALKRQMAQDVARVRALALEPS